MRFLQKVINTLTGSLKKASKADKGLRIIFDATIFLLFIGALTQFPLFSAHADSSLTVDGSQQFQTIDGLGINANSLSWKNGELKPAIDMLADDMGSTIWRVVFDMEDWEASNDNADPNVFNWDYYNSVYSSQKFQNLWGTIGYLNQKGVSSGIILSFMGNVSNWMGGTRINSAYEDEWVEMIASLVYYARNTMHLSFSMLDPMNETDIGGNEGPLVDKNQYTRLLHKLSDKLDSLGLSDMKFVGPATAGLDNGVNSYMPVMMADSVVMAKTDHFGLHNYDPVGDDAYQAIKNSAYPNRNYYITETTDPVAVFYALSQGTSAIMIWEGYDSVYNHGILNGGGTIPPNDSALGKNPLAYNTTTGIYSPRKCFYVFKQIFKFVSPGSISISTTEFDSNVVILAFYHQPSGRVTIVGRNSGANSVSYAGTLFNLPGISALQFYQTSETDPNINFLKGNDIVVSNGALSFVAPPKSVFTLTGLVDGADLTPPTVSLTTPINGATVSNTVTINATATDNVGIEGVQFLLNGVNLGAKIYSPPYSLSWDTMTVANGTYTLSAVAQDIGGNIANSSSLQITVTNQDSIPPTIAITNPLQNAVVSGTITVTANATDTFGVAGVQFLLDGSPFKPEVTSAPYTVTLDTTTLSDSSHTISAVARDMSNNQATSNPVTFAVINTPGSILPIKLIQKSSNFISSAKSLSTTLPSMVTDGNLIVVSVSGWPNLPASTAVSDSLGNAYSIAGTVLISQDAYSAIYYAKNVKGGTDTVTFNTVTTGGQISIAVAEFSGVDKVSPLDKTAGTVSSGTIPSSGMMTPSMAGELVIGSGTHNGNTVTTAGAGFSMIAIPTEDSNAHQPLAMEYQVLTGNQQTTVNFNLAVGYPWTQNGVLFKPAVSQGPDNTPPTVSINSPQDGSTVSSIITVSADASDNAGVSKVEFSLDNVLQATVTSSPYNWIWNTSQVPNGSHDIKAIAYDAAGNKSSASVSVLVNNIVTAPSITTISLPGGTVNVSFSATLAASGGTIPYSWSIVSGSLPSGLSLNSSTGAISGTPTAAGMFTFTVRVTDNAAQIATRQLSITIAAAQTLSITTTSLPNGRVGNQYSRTLAATGGTKPYAWSIASGSLPPGLTLNSGTGRISGTPTTNGTFSFTARVTDSGNPVQQTTTRALSIRIRR